jgi:hypothetical protein
MSFGGPGVRVPKGRDYNRWKMDELGIYLEHSSSRVELRFESMTWRSSGHERFCKLENKILPFQNI